MPQTLRYLSYPFRGGALVVNLLFSLIFVLLIEAFNSVGLFALFSLPLWLLLLGAYLGYCFTAGAQAADGSLDPPPAGYSQLSPFNLRPVLFAASMAAIYAALSALLDRLPALLVLALIAPAAAGAFIAHRPVYALNPVLWWHIILRLGTRYPMMVGLLALVSLLIHYRPDNLLLLVSISMTMACGVGLFFGLGRILYLNRDRLGLESDGSEEERRERIEQRQRNDEFRKRVADWHRLHARGHHQDAVDVIRAWLEVTRGGIEDWELVFDALLEWHDTRTAALYAAYLVEKLDNLKMAPRAFSHYQTIWDRHGPVALNSDTQLYRMAQLAKDAGRNDIAARLLKNLPHLFPDSPLVGTSRTQVDALKREGFG